MLEMVLYFSLWSSRLSLWRRRVKDFCSDLRGVEETWGEMSVMETPKLWSVRKLGPVKMGALSS